MPCDARGSCDQQKDTRRHIVCSTGIQDEISSIDAEFIAGLLERLTIRASRIVNHACRPSQDTCQIESSPHVRVAERYH